MIEFGMASSYYLRKFSSSTLLSLKLSSILLSAVHYLLVASSQDQNVLTVSHLVLSLLTFTLTLYLVDLDSLENVIPRTVHNILKGSYNPHDTIVSLSAHLWLFLVVLAPLPQLANDPLSLTKIIPLLNFFIWYQLLRTMYMYLFIYFTVVAIWIYTIKLLVFTLIF
jgi:hypothetical protein